MNFYETEEEYFENLKYPMNKTLKDENGKFKNDENISNEIEIIYYKNGNIFIEMIDKKKYFEYDENGILREYRVYDNKKCHNPYAPAVFKFDEYGNIIETEWFYRGINKTDEVKKYLEENNLTIEKMSELTFDKMWNESSYPFSFYEKIEFHDNGIKKSISFYNNNNELQDYKKIPAYREYDTNGILIREDRHIIESKDEKIDDANTQIENLKYIISSMDTPMKTDHKNKKPIKLYYPSGELLISYTGGDPYQYDVYNLDGSYESRIYYGEKCHNDNGPAIKFYDSSNTLTDEKWFYNDEDKTENVLNYLKENSLDYKNMNVVQFSSMWKHIHND